MEDSTPISVRPVGIKFGLIAGLIGTVQFLIVSMSGSNPFDTIWAWVGVGITAVMIVLAHKSFKDNGDGYMTFGQGMGIAFWFALASTLLTLPISYIFLTYIAPDVMDLFYEQQIAKMEASGQPEAAIEMAMEWTKKLFWVFAAIMPLFWDMLIALILTIFTQKKRPEQTF